MGRREKGAGVDVKYEITAEVKVCIDSQDQGYAAKDMERKLLTMCDWVRIADVKKQSTGAEPNNYGVNKVEQPVIKIAKPAEVQRVQKDPGLRVTFCKN
jgi:hypothetical protein